MLFQQFTALVTLMVFALPQGVMALPHPANAASETAGKTLGSLARFFAPDNVKNEARAIMGAGGMLFQQFITIVSLIVFAPQGDDTLVRAVEGCGNTSICD
ncbi:hypothetical protein BYT27DRAFT_7339566 [Phlegmacium glaucopus]|nr:hypothetical protein BYT27DRAFT_7339566 [Phlegmacium glaucopus]